MVLGLFFPLLAVLTGEAQTTVTGWSLSSSDVADSTAYSPTQTFRNTTFSVNSITAGTTKYADSTATAAFVRRNTDSSGNGTPNQSGVDNNNRSAIWEVQDGNTTTNLRGLNPSSMSISDVLLGNNVLMGVNDVFSNGYSQNYESNIERIDFYWAGGFTAVSSDGFAVFERGQASLTGHDSFQIAVFTGWDSVNNRPTTYSGNVVEVSSSAYGSSNLDWDPTTGGTQSNFNNYRILRFNNGDNLSTLDVNSSGNTNQGIAGVFISFADLGIAPGTTIYGYSLMATDVTNTVANLADWTNATYYPTNTSDSTIGSIDLMAYNGRRFVPEPTTYGAALVSVAAAFVFWRRQRRVTAQAA